ncbi:hypothetical protein MesoLjLc_71890 [Mesorhizobium sp. L-8-10]|nr:hypothetical protein MesoLjLc_71890 [Mesorhizobium sp. L-8-10]
MLNASDQTASELARAFVASYGTASFGRRQARGKRPQWGRKLTGHTLPDRAAPEQQLNVERFPKAGRQDTAPNAVIQASRLPFQERPSVTVRADETGGDDDGLGSFPP